MRFLHLADLHLGKSIYGTSLIDNGDQKVWVDRFLDLARNLQPQAVSLVEYKLETGRKNQIRVHSADIGHPVCGDVKYGNGDDPIHRLCLHAYKLCSRPLHLSP